MCGQNGKIKLLINSEYRRELTEELKKAKYNIIVLAYEWHFGDMPLGSPMFNLNLEFKNAVKRGVKVSAIVRHETTARRLNQAGIKAIAYTQKNLLHSKIIILDREKFFCGSHNLTTNGITHNEEISTLTESKEEALKLEEYIKNIW